MKSWSGFLRKRRAIIASFVLTCFSFITAEKISEYSSPPSKEKDCDYLYPRGVSQTKPTTILLKSDKPSLPLEQTGGFVNDASCLNKTAVYGVVKIATVEDIRNALEFARDNHLKVAIAGQRHSMGGQSLVEKGLILDLRPFNQIRLDKTAKIATVQSGATWAQVQHLIDQDGLAVQAMQSINVFTVGGALSVNAHGIAHRPGPLASTVKSFRIMLSNGEIKTAAPNENPELFRLALGGYGLFGVILDADIQLVDNEMYRLKTQYMSYRDFARYYDNSIGEDDKFGLVYGRLSVSPSSYLTEAAIHTYEKTDFEGKLPALTPVAHDRLDRLIINFSKTGAFGRWVRWTLEKYAEPGLHTCLPRNQAMSEKEVCLVSRNQEMYDSMTYLRNRLNDTDILQEYFIPHTKTADFVDGLRTTIKRDGANLLNVTIRAVHKDTVTALPYAKEDMFAFVLYFNQKFNDRESKILQTTTIDLIDLATSLNGTFYLQYQLYYSKGQLRKSYPEIDTFFAAKKSYDPIGLFTNKFYEKYGN
jgi:FAD/FMN-containing dehydrogenase